MARKLQYTKSVYYSTQYRIGRLVGRIKSNMMKNPETINFVKIPKVKKSRKQIQYRGYYWPDEEKIDIDYRYEIIPTLIHEHLHHFHDKWPEKKIEQEERCIMSRLSKKHATKLIKTLSDVLTLMK